MTDMTGTLARFVLVLAAAVTTARAVAAEDDGEAAKGGK